LNKLLEIENENMKWQQLGSIETESCTCK
jgi:hypothetical protein